MRQGTVERWQRGRSRQGGFRMKEDLSEKKKKTTAEWGLLCPHATQTHAASCCPQFKLPPFIPD